MPNRLIKEAVWTSPNLNQVSDLAERHFYRLLPLPDDHGCCEVTPLVVKGRCYPLKNKVTPEMIQKWNGELESVDIIRTWEVLGRIYGWFPKWSEHQRIRSLHQRKTPEPPSDVLNGQRLTTSDDSECHSHLNPNPILNPDLNPISPSEKSDKPTSSKKTHPRLGIFLEEYKNSTGRDYIVGNYREEGGAAKGTENKIPDEAIYRQAVRAYLAAVDKRIVEASFPYLWFIRDLNRWVGVAQERGSHGTDKYTGFAGKDYSEGTW